MHLDPYRESSALVLGGNGQDGSYLAEHLVANGVAVVSVGRQERPVYPIASQLFRYEQLDLADENLLSHFLRDLSPARIFHLAAVHGSAGFFYEDKWQEALRVNVGSAHICLEYMREQRTDARFLYASSLKAFGAVPPPIVSELSPRISSCLYSITKNAAAELVDYYRRQHGLRASVVYLFNHDSPRRPATYFLPRIVSVLAAAIEGKKGRASVRTLDFACDWGASDEFMRIVHALIEADPNQDYVVATGEAITGRDLVESLFLEAGLDWRDHVAVEESAETNSPGACHADISRLRATLGYRPQKKAIDVARWILRESHNLILPHPSGGLA